MEIDNFTIPIIMAVIAACNMFIVSVVHWDKIRPVLCSRFMISIAELALMCGCFWLGKWGIIVGANVYIMLEFFDFVRRNDNSCGAIGSAILTIALGVFNFAIQFALAIKGN